MSERDSNTKNNVAAQMDGVQSPEGFPFHCFIESNLFVYL